MRLGIDASNIRSGGGITHLVQILLAADPPAHGFDSVVVWASRQTLARLQDRPWLRKRHAPALESNYLRRALWQRKILGDLARSERCDVLLVPGGAFATAFRPIVCMSRNLLPFEWHELARYGCSPTGVRLLLLRWSLARSFRKADGTVFLTRYARAAVDRVTGPLSGRVSIIPHGLDARFFQTERQQRALADCTEAAPFRIIYVSIVDLYKHQWHVAEAVARLRAAGIPASLVLVGPGYPPALRRLRSVMQRLDPQGKFLSYAGPIAHEELPRHYAAADLCVFASSCENMPNILLEGMASALPIACSSRGPMPEILGGAGRYFDPEDPQSIADALVELANSAALRARLAHDALEAARAFSWERCARDTFNFLAQLAARTAADARPAG